MNRRQTSSSTSKHIMLISVVTTLLLPQKSFTVHYRRKEKSSLYELEEYFKLPTEDFDGYHCTGWWSTCSISKICSDWLATDILLWFPKISHCFVIPRMSFNMHKSSLVSNLVRAKSSLLPPSHQYPTCQIKSNFALVKPVPIVKAKNFNGSRATRLTDPENTHGQSLASPLEIAR